MRTCSQQDTDMESVTFKVVKLEEKEECTGAVHMFDIMDN